MNFKRIAILIIHELSKAVFELIFRIIDAFILWTHHLIQNPIMYRYFLSFNIRRNEF